MQAEPSGGSRGWVISLLCSFWRWPALLGCCSFLHLQNTSFTPIYPSILCLLPPSYKDPCDCIQSTGSPCLPTPPTLPTPLHHFCRSLHGNQYPSYRELIINHPTLRNESWICSSTPMEDTRRHASYTPTISSAWQRPHCKYRLSDKEYFWTPVAYVRPQNVKMQNLSCSHIGAVCLSEASQLTQSFTSLFLSPWSLITRAQLGAKDPTGKRTVDSACRATR